MARKITGDRLLRDLQTVVEDAEELLQATAAQTGDKVEGVRARAQDSLRWAKSRIAEIEGDALDQVRAAASSADDYVQGNPWQAIALAAGVGLLLGLLISRR